MTSYPNFVVSQVSTTVSLEKNKRKQIKLEKSQPFFCLKMTYILSEKIRSYKNYVRWLLFFDFAFWLNNNMRSINVQLSAYFLVRNLML